MKTLSLILLLLVHLAFGADTDNACVSNRPLFPSDSPVSFYSVSSGRTTTQFNKYHATGISAIVNEGTQTHISDDIAKLEILSSTSRHTDVRAGVFSCSFSCNGFSYNVLVINHRKNSKILPKDVVTKTVSVGETVSFDVDSKSAKIKWKRKGAKVSQWNGLKTITLTNVSASDAGVYEAYSACAHSPHAFMRLIVKECPMNRYGSECQKFCLCYNGGMCNEEGLCVCPPGFIGDSCEIVKSPNCFGPQCEQWCDDQMFQLNYFQGTCGGNLFCLPDPYGCSCSPGYRGLGCDSECEEGTFGPDCSQTCHCASGSTCDTKMGTCTPLNCEDGWTGTNCNQKVTCKDNPCQNGATCQEEEGSQEYRCECPPGFIGERCELIDESACESSPCENGGTCVVAVGGTYECHCKAGFEGIHCEIQKVTCKHNPCQNGATCQEDEGSQEYWCECPPGFIGDRCELIDESACESSPCENGGTCVVVVGGAYECLCKAGFEGIHCEIRACGGFFTDPTATITSPSHPEGYPHNSHCIYVVQAGSDCVVRLSFTMISIEFDKGCNYDYVEVYDNRTTTEGSELMGRFCGKEIPPVLTSKGNVMTVVFHSDGTYSYGGFMATYETLESLPDEGDVRLVDGASATEGRVEVYHDSQWGTICDNDWDDHEATVICRHLGLGDKGAAICCGGFGKGTGQIWLDNVACTGSERSIVDCSSPGWGADLCSHSQDAGVRCIGEAREEKKK